jgi:large subunit ribosomal protein L29
MVKQKSNIKSSKEMNKEAKEKKPLTKEEILAQYRSALVVLRMKSKMGQLVKTHQIKELKKEIARLLTADKIVMKNK